MRNYLKNIIGFMKHNYFYKYFKKYVVLEFYLKNIIIKKKNYFQSRVYSNYLFPNRKKRQTSFFD